MELLLLLLFEESFGGINSIIRSILLLQLLLLLCVLWLFIIFVICLVCFISDGKIFISDGKTTFDFTSFF